MSPASGRITENRRGASGKVLARDPLALPTARGRSLRLPPRNPQLGRDPELDRRWLERVGRPWAIDLFAGAGGLSLGLKEAGFSVIAAAERDPVTLETHAANIGGLSHRTDLCDPSEFIEFLQQRGVGKVELVAGGPPCQPFSRAASAKLRDLVQAGIREPEDARTDLWQSFLMVVDALSPDAVLLENVPDMASWSNGAIVVSMLEALRERGYKPDARVLKAWEFGVPQHRARLFVIGTRGEFTWPRRRSRVTLRDAIADLPRADAGQRQDAVPYPGRPNTAFQRRARRKLSVPEMSVIRDHCTRDVRADDAEAYALLGEGQTYKDLPGRLRRYRADIFDDKYKRLAWDDLSRTITAHIAKDGYWYIHPDQSRTLSIREAARIQTFPDRFRFAGHPSVQLRQVGNAVPPALAHAVGRRLRASLSARRAAPHTPIGAQLRAWQHEHGRDFPWRGERDPWRVLMAEMCLRRTRADSVQRVYERLVNVAPTPRAALVSRDRVLAELQPLGLRWRSKNLLDVAAELMDRHDGRVPRSEVELRGLTGVGDYVASAVRCFAFGEQTVLLDANTRRIVSRVSALDGSSAWTTRLEIYRWAGADGPDETFNYALLDFGALVCKPGRPSCGACPIQARCRSAVVP